MKNTSTSTKDKLLDAAVQLMLAKGYTATGVEEICKAAGITKGSFFHYFDSKEALGVAAIEHFWKLNQDLFQQRTNSTIKEPLKLLFAHLDLYVEAADSPLIRNSCLLGNFSQELSQTHPEIRRRCQQGFMQWKNTLALLIENAKKKYAPTSSINSQSLADHFIASFEGALVLAKAHQDTSLIQTCVNHYKEYMRILFTDAKGGGKL